MPRTVCFLAILIITLSAVVVWSPRQPTAEPAADGKAAEVIRFIACPIYRDTDQGPKSGCWLADRRETGVRYDITKARSKPFLGQEVLVEGFATDAPNKCGGTVLKPVRVSTLETRCTEHILPPGEFSGRAFELPDRVMQPKGQPRDVPPAPYEPRTFTIYFTHGSDFPIYQHSELIMEDAAIYAKASDAESVVVTGYAVTTGTHVSGRVLTEDLGLAKSRAQKIATAMRRLLVPEEALSVKWSGKPQSTVGGDEGLLEASKRRVTIAITP